MKPISRLVVTVAPGDGSHRVVYLPAVDKVVALGVYVRAVKRAKANPTLMFSHGLNCWWPCTGAEIVEQFRRGMHDRINHRVPYSQRGKEQRICQNKTNRDDEG